MIRWLVPLIAVALAPTAYADMYKCVDDSGHVTYSNTGGKGCRRVVIEPAYSAPPPPAQTTPAAPAFPRVDREQQRARDDMRRRILETELETERRALEEARARLAEQDQRIDEGERNVTQRCTPTADGGMSCVAVPGGINAAKVEERLKPLRDQVALHERNIEALNRELSALR